MHPEFGHVEDNINLEFAEENVELKILEFLIHIVCKTVRTCSRMKKSMKEFFSKKTLLKLLPCSTRTRN